MDIPDDRKAALENLPTVTKRTLIRSVPSGPTKDPGEYLFKLKHVIDAGKDYKVCVSASVTLTLEALAFVVISEVSASHALSTFHCLFGHVHTYLYNVSCTFLTTGYHTVISPCLLLLLAKPQSLHSSYYLP